MRIYIDILIQVFLVNSLFIFGIYAITGKDMIFGFMQRWKVFKENKPEPYDPEVGISISGELIRYDDDIGKRRNDMIKKPLFNCPPCMASIWGTAGFVYTGIGWEYWIVWVLSLAGFNYIVNKIIDK